MVFYHWGWKNGAPLIWGGWVFIVLKFFTNISVIYSWEYTLLIFIQKKEMQSHFCLAWSESPDPPSSRRTGPASAGFRQGVLRAWHPKVLHKCLQNGVRRWTVDFFLSKGSCQAQSPRTASPHDWILYHVLYRSSRCEGGYPEKAARRCWGSPEPDTGAPGPALACHCSVG